MSDLLADLQSTRWWVSVIIVGILVSVVSQYLVRVLDDQLAATSSWWRKRRKADVEQYTAELQSVRGNAHKQLLLANRETRSRLRAIVALVQAIASAFLVIGLLTLTAPLWLSIAGMVLFAFFWIIYLHEARVADRAEKLLGDVDN